MTRGSIPSKEATSRSTSSQVPRPNTGTRGSDRGPLVLVFRRLGEEMTTARSSRTTRERGFTLLEVLVALVILSVAVVAVIQGFAQGLRLLKLSGDHQRAMQLADQKVREVLVPEAQREHGAEAGFRWD